MESKQLIVNFPKPKDYPFLNIAGDNTDGYYIKVNEG